ncbi:MAG: hypothetical protein GWN84_24010 [Gammaproteobacteria bacterium]|nr:hypothetical protein [Gammaproteobacteria bacterium]NIR85648.1 hypothetical protein [Gammaproteobacteria bacterium]NIR90136.1 hypothetical protein [Gammaproteobacteria bacterium]NIU06782.1 hypothetical protein [Gammaproteobacteria bacterium]NIV53715.1 hypothetical protein [Gammaproteobacteria bacterium]
MKIPRKGAILVFLLGGLAGVVFSGAFASFVQYSNTMEFCISCHVMEATVYQELKKTKHYENQSGVRAKCADCHVPHGNWVATLVRKVRATKELWYNTTGLVNTPEELEAKRLELAESVWASMQANDSRECRNCHTREAMNIAAQTKRAQVKHEEARDEGKTCIDCHKGLVHKPVHEELEEEEPPPEDFTL